MKRGLIAALVLTVAAPSFAQYAPRDYQSEGSVARQSVRHKAPVRQSGTRAFAMVPRLSPGPSLDDPSLTGGGSAGFNALLRTY